MHVASFPWEPPPVPQPMVANPTPVPSNVPRPQQIPSSGSSPASIPLPSSNSGGVRIKTEPGSYDTSGIPQSNTLTGNYGSAIAQQRAARNIQQKFGANANMQINQLHAQAGLGNSGQQPHRIPQNIQLPPQPEQHRRDMAEQQRQQTQQDHYQHLQQAQQQRQNVGSSQTDGADDWTSMVAERRAAALENSMSIHDADLSMRQRLEQMSRSMEGGGVMLPLSEQPKNPLANRKRKPVSPPNPSSSSTYSFAAAQVSIPSRIPQLDGLDSDSDETKAHIKDDPDLEDDTDEDAINSDLDDPDDDDAIADEGEDGKEGQIMLCTYDKVQRVKSKWKCTLKDGVLTTGGRE